MYHATQTTISKLRSRIGRALQSLDGNDLGFASNGKEPMFKEVSFKALVVGCLTGIRDVTENYNVVSEFKVRTADKRFAFVDIALIPHDSNHRQRVLIELKYMPLSYIKMNSERYNYSRMVWRLSRNGVAAGNRSWQITRVMPHDALHALNSHGLTDLENETIYGWDWTSFPIHNGRGGSTTLCDIRQKARNQMNRYLELTPTLPGVVIIGIADKLVNCEVTYITEQTGSEETCSTDEDVPPPTVNDTTTDEDAFESSIDALVSDTNKLDI